MGIEECVDVNCNFVWSFLLEASPSANLHLQSTTFAVLRLTANGEPWMPFGNHCRSDSQRNAVMLLRERHKVKRFSVRTVWKDLVFFFFSSLSKYFYYHVKFISFISISMKNILFSCQPHRQWTKWNFVKNFVTCIVYILIFRYKFKISCLEQFCKKVLQFSVYNLSFFIYESNSSFITISQQWMIEWLLKIRFLHQS